MLISIAAICNQLPWMPRVMKLDAAQDTPSFFWGEGFIEGRGGMSIAVILNDAKIFGFGIGTIDQPPNTLSMIELGAPLRHFHMAPPGQRLNHEEQVGCA